MKVSILIPTLATPKSLPYLKKCVEMIHKNSKEDHNILTMVNGENFITLDFVKTFYRRPQGQCGAVNALAKEVDDEWILVTNDDSMFPPHWERIFDNADKSDVICFNSMESGKIGAAPPFVVNDCGQDLENFKEEKFEGAAAGQGREAILESEKEGGKPWLEKGFNLPFIVKKELWDKIGGYDEKYDPWGSNSDSDLHYKFKLAGVQPLRDRRILNYHFSQISGTFDFMNEAREKWTNDTKLKEEAWNNNTRYFQEKWGFVRARSPEIWFDINLPKEHKYHPEWEKK